jgi:hypothetical protein
MVRTPALEVIMGMVQGIAATSDRVLEALKSGLEVEFGRGAGEALAAGFMRAEEVDFRWDARIEERWIGAYQNAEGDEFELDRIACLGPLDGQWFCATILVDGDGQAHGMTGCRTFLSRARAQDAMLHAH